MLQLPSFERLHIGHELVLPLGLKPFPAGKVGAPTPPSAAPMALAGDFFGSISDPYLLVGFDSSRSIFFSADQLNSPAVLPLLYCCD
jgi:hypothetical protein